MNPENAADAQKWGLRVYMAGCAIQQVFIVSSRHGRRDLK